MVAKGAVVKEPGSTRKNKTGSWRTFKPVADKDKCISCGACAAECPVGCISQGDTTYVIDKNSCIGCGTCAGVCPVSAPEEE